MWVEAVGWAAALALLATILTQVAKQWNDRTSQGVSPWLFAGQMAASAGFAVYSFLLDNTVFMVTNVLTLASAILGQAVVWRNQRLPVRKKTGSR